MEGKYSNKKCLENIFHTLYLTDLLSNLESVTQFSFDTDLCSKWECKRELIIIYIWVLTKSW